MILLEGWEFTNVAVAKPSLEEEVYIIISDGRRLTISRGSYSQKYGVWADKTGRKITGVIGWKI